MAAESSRAGGGHAGDVLLHGDLELRVVKARNLPNMDMFMEHLRRLFGTCGIPISLDNPAHLVREVGGGEHPQPRAAGRITSDPYVKVCVAGATVARTRVIPNSQDPDWEEHFRIPLAHRAALLEFEVKDNDFLGAQVMGTATLSAARVASGEPFKGWLPILGTSGRSLKPNCELYVSLHFMPVEKNPLYRHGIAGDPEDRGIMDTYFPVRKGGKVTLYQDAHVREGELPEIKLAGGRVFEHERCWEDICHAIMDAQRLIYIAGWSIYHKVKLVREPTRPLPIVGDFTLGELLKYKSQEGVRVCLLVWDDKTSHDKLFFKTKGVMQTHDEETRRFFKNSSVICVLSPRYASSKLSMVKQQVVGTIFTHHQKCILVDTEAFGSKRKISAFLGGLDLCNGRYDTPQHRLYDDDGNIFDDDFQNPSLKPQTKGPREPWHDLHCKIEGPAAYDVLKNFEQRWLKATRFRVLIGRSFQTHWRDDALINVDRISWVISPKTDHPYGDPNTWVSTEADPETWHVQVFRSIDSGSVRDFPKYIPEAESMNLVCGKNLVIDKSIQTAYVKAIRSAQHFIYIENQYFLGSSHGWLSYKNPEADNLVPMELALKIASKIREGKRFAVYVVIPMWPEGDPSSNAVQEVLFWQSQTMRMMYDIIAKELKSNNLENAHPQDYLNFYCLGARELQKIDFQSQIQLPGEMVSLSHKFRRFMIYVHSKGMIVDDEYVILGSANINQRSMDGSRDTEIAMGAYQPHHTWAARKNHPGQVYGYRMSLWAEHLGMVDELFQEPQSLACVKFVNKLAEENRIRYIAPVVTPLKGQLLPYPISVDINGNVEALPGQESFPDFGDDAKVLGKPNSLPDQLTM